MVYALRVPKPDLQLKQVLINSMQNVKFLMHLQHPYRYLYLPQYIKFAETIVQHVDHPKYLGVTLDRSLTY
jgi:hypothetical protein